MHQNHLAGSTHRISDLGLRWGPGISSSNKLPGDTDTAVKGPRSDGHSLYNDRIQLHPLYMDRSTISVCLGLKVSCSRKSLSPRKTETVGFPTCIRIFPRLLLKGQLLLTSSLSLWTGQKKGPEKGVPST